MGLFGAYIVGVRLIGIDAGAFWVRCRPAWISGPNVTNGIIKSGRVRLRGFAHFGFRSYECQPTAEGVSSATTRLSSFPRSRFSLSISS